MHNNPTAPQGMYVWKGLLELKEAFHEVCNGKFLGLLFV
jgi:hypothetical protein